MKNRVVQVIMGLPKSIIVNIRYLGIKSIFTLPILVSKNVKLRRLSGVIKIEAPISMGMIRLGFDSVGIFDEKLDRSIWEVEGKVVFKGKCKLGNGFRIYVGKEGQLILGNSFIITADSTIICKKKIIFEDNVLISWKCMIMDTDFHNILNEKGEVINKDEEIIIKYNVWICSRSTILKGTIINNDSILGCDSIVSSKFKEANVLIAGNPAKVIKKSVTWEV